MAEPEPDSKPKHKHKHKHLQTDQDHQNPTKLPTNFLYKALVITLFLIILPLFPSQAPEFINQTLLTRTWELLHLLIVGIAVSYGIFGRLRNEDDSEKETNPSKFDSAQSYVSKLLQVSSVFDDDTEMTSSGSGENKIQTWSNQYMRNEPMVVVAKDQSVIEEERISSEKPLFLPVRSLKSRVVIDGAVEEGGSMPGAIIGGSRRLDGVNTEEKLIGNVVLPSPIPWRSRSGRMEMNEQIGNHSSMEESELNRADSRASSRRYSKTNSESSSPRKLSPSSSMSSSPRKLSPSPSLLSETLKAESSVRKNSFYRAPPPPPPPPPTMTYKSPSVMRSGSYSNAGEGFNVNNGDNLRNKVNPRVDEVQETAKIGSTGSVFDKRMADKTSKQTESDKSIELVDHKPIRKTVKFNNERVTCIPRNQTFMKYPKDDSERYVDKTSIETDNDSRSDADMDDDEDADDDADEDEYVNNSPRSVVNPNDEEVCSGGVSDGGPDVDKKADEFIAKFREQIRLQRIESIKKSSGQISRRSTFSK